MKNSQKGSTTVVLSIVIVLLVIAFGAYIYLQKNSQTLPQVSGSQTTTQATTTQSATTQNTTAQEQSPHIDSVTPFVDTNGTTEFTITGTGFLGSYPYVDGQSATYGADVTDTVLTLISVKQLAVSGPHSVYLINSAGQKSNIVDFTK